MPERDTGIVLACASNADPKRFRILKEHPICALGLHCRHCRSREGGREFRAGLKAVLKVIQTDFECPHGIEWEAGPQDSPALQRPPRSRAEVESLLAEHCAGCEHELIGPAERDWPEGVPGCRRVVTRGGRPCFSKFVAGLAGGEGCPEGRHGAGEGTARVASPRLRFTQPFVRVAVIAYCIVAVDIARGSACGV